MGQLPRYSIRFQRPIWIDDVSNLADKLLLADCIKFGKFTLKSGIEFPIYIDLDAWWASPQLLNHSEGLHPDFTRITV